MPTNVVVDTNNSPVSYSFVEPVMCTVDTAITTMVLSIDTYATIPTWLSYTRNTGVNVSFTLSPTGTDAGIYPVRVRFTDSYSGGYAEATFIIDVIPQPLIVAPAVTTTCSSDIMPMTIGIYSS